MATNESLSITETIDNKRYYNITGKDGLFYKLPSVTTILSAMTDNTSIKKWRERIGNEEADRISTFACNRGTIMHQKLEYFFTSDIDNLEDRINDVNIKLDMFVKENGFTDEEYKCGNMLFDKLRICGFFNRVSSVIEMENTLFSLENGGYAGRVDCIYKNRNGEKVLLDFKTSKHTKRSEWITSYFMQLSAYWLAYYQMHGILLDKAELWIAVEDPNSTPQIIEISKEELKKWLGIYLDLVRKYHEKYDYLLQNDK